MQAAVLIFDLKPGAQLGANPLGQMTGHLVGSFVGALPSAAFYKLHTRTSPIPGPVFRIPNGVYMAVCCAGGLWCRGFRKEFRGFHWVCGFLYAEHGGQVVLAWLLVD